jgi:hypothetical protein
VKAARALATGIPRPLDNRPPGKLAPSMAGVPKRRQGLKAL